LGAAGYISSGKIFSFFSFEDSRPSKFLFQTARGSGATLSECTFSIKKRTSIKEFFQEKTTSRFLFERIRIELVPPGKTRENKKVSEFNHETLGGLSIWDPQDSSSEQLLAVDPDLAHCQTKEA
jgi:hypothetical protein